MTTGISELIQMECKGMVQVLDQTYRIMKVTRRSYEVVRILDDVLIGKFEVNPKLRVHPNGVTRELLQEIAVTALKQAKVSWVGPVLRSALVPPPRRDSQAL
jgi:hypothetical protein